MNLEEDDLTLYRRIVKASYPENKKRGDENSCLSARQTLLEHLLLLTGNELQEEENRFRICALAFDACIFAESGPQKGDIIDFKYDVEPMLIAVMRKLNPELAESIFHLLHDLEYTETYDRKPFITHDEALMEFSSYDEDKPIVADDFEQNQIVHKDDIGFDNEDEED